MIRTNVVPGTYTANADIPLNLSVQAGTSETFVNNGIQLNNTGIEDCYALVTFTPGASGDITLSLFANGVAIDGAQSSMTVSSGVTVTFVIPKKLVVLPRYLNTRSVITARIDATGTLEGGYIEIAY